MVNLLTRSALDTEKEEEESLAVLRSFRDQGLIRFVSPHQATHPYDDATQVRYLVAKPGIVI